MKKILLIILAICFYAITSYGQVSQDFNSLAGNLFNNSTTCGFFDANTAAHKLANDSNACGAVIVTAPSTAVAGNQIGFDTYYEGPGNGTGGFSDGDFFGVATSSALVSQVGATADGTNGFLMEDVDGSVRLEFADISLVGTTSPMVSIQYMLASTVWESADLLEIIVNIKDCAGATTLTLIDVSGTAMDAVEASWNTLSANLTPYIGCVSNVQVRFSSESASEELGLDNLIYTQGALPVELLSFDSRTENNHVSLSWTTASEINNDYFDVQRSSDGKSFETIGKVNGNGTTNEEQSYGFVDRSPTSGVNYYRLAQYDYNGEMEYHKVISVTLRNSTTSIYPTSTLHSINVEIKEPSIASIITADGKLISSKSFEESGTLDVANLPSGIYYVRILTDQSMETHRFVKE